MTQLENTQDGPEPPAAALSMTPMPRQAQAHAPNRHLADDQRKLHLRVKMSAIDVHVTEMGVPAGTASKSYELDVPGLTSAEGWVWYRPSPWWIEAAALRSLDALKPLTIHMMLVRAAEEYVCILPVSSSTALANLTRRTSPGSCSGFELNIRGASTKRRGRTAVVVTRSRDPKYLAALIRVAISEARKWILDTPVAYQSRVQGPLDGVGFCTWNSLGKQGMNEDNVKRLVDRLVREHIPIQTFVLDDGWQNVRKFTDEADGSERQGLWNFNAAPAMGNGGLKALVDMIKARFFEVPSTGTTNVGVWLTLTGGYWDGIHPLSPLVEKYGCRTYVATEDFWRGTVGDSDEREPGVSLPKGQREYILPPPERAEDFWRDWFRYLRMAGVTFVKVDNQASLMGLNGAKGVEAALAMWSAMYAVSREVFGPGRVIHCMAQSEAVWAGPQGLGLTTQGERFVWRNSDDYGLTMRGPNIHQQHIFVNLMNTPMSNTLCTVPDADMFMTSAMHPHVHAFLRALFPGPMLLTDPPGEVDTKLLWRMIARDRTGTARVLRPPRAAEPLARRLLDTTIRDNEDGTGMWAAVEVGPVKIIGLFNVRGSLEHPCRIRDALTVADIEDALGHRIDATHVVVRMGVQNPGVVAASLVRTRSEGTVAVIDDLPMLSAASLWVSQIQRMGVGLVAVLGLINHYTGPAALESVNVAINHVDIKLKYAGTLGIMVAAPLKPSATAIIDKYCPAPVKITCMPALDGTSQMVYLLEIEVSYLFGPGDVWNVRLHIE